MPPTHLHKPAVFLVLNSVLITFTQFAPRAPYRRKLTASWPQVLHPAARCTPPRTPRVSNDGSVDDVSSDFGDVLEQLHSAQDGPQGGSGASDSTQVINVPQQKTVTQQTDVDDDEQACALALAATPPLPQATPAALATSDDSGDAARSSSAPAPVPSTSSDQGAAGFEHGAPAAASIAAQLFRTAAICCAVLALAGNSATAPAAEPSSSEADPAGASTASGVSAVEEAPSADTSEAPSSSAPAPPAERDLPLQPERGCQDGVGCSGRVGYVSPPAAPARCSFPHLPSLGSSFGVTSTASSAAAGQGAAGSARHAPAAAADRRAPAPVRLLGRPAPWTPLAHRQPAYLAQCDSYLDMASLQQVSYLAGGAFGEVHVVEADCADSPTATNWTVVRLRSWLLSGFCWMIECHATAFTRAAAAACACAGDGRAKVTASDSLCKFQTDSNRFKPRLAFRQRRLARSFHTHSARKAPNNQGLRRATCHRSASPSRWCATTTPTPGPPSAPRSTR